MSDKEVICELSAEARRTQSAGWADLRQYCRGTTVKPDEVVVLFDARCREVLDRLVETEQDCCSFLILELADSGDRLQLRLGSKSPAGWPVVAGLVELVTGHAHHLAASTVVSHPSWSTPSRS